MRRDFESSVAGGFLCLGLNTAMVQGLGVRVYGFGVLLRILLVWVS